MKQKKRGYISLKKKKRGYDNGVLFIGFFDLRIYIKHLNPNNVGLKSKLFWRANSNISIFGDKQTL